MISNPPNNSANAKSPKEQLSDALLALGILVPILITLGVQRYLRWSFLHSLYLVMGFVGVLSFSAMYWLARRNKAAVYIPEGHKLLLGEFLPEKPWQKSDPVSIGIRDMTHGLLTGGTRYGKSTLIRRFESQVAEHDLPFLLVDFKGDQNDFDEVLRIARSKYLDDRLQVFDLMNPETCATCNFLTVFKNVEEAVGFVIELFEFDEPFYRECAEAFTRHALRLFDYLGEHRSFRNLERLLQDDLFRNRLLGRVSIKDRELPFYTFFGKFERLREDDRTRNYGGFLNKLSPFGSGELERIFNPERSSFPLGKLFEENIPAVVRIPGEAYGELSRRLVKAFLKAIPVLLSKRRALKNPKDYFLFLDEGCSYPSSNLIDIVKKAGSANVHCVLTRQCVGDFNIIHPDAENQIVSACSLKFNFRTIDPETRDALAKQSGTHTTTKDTRRVRAGQDTGEASERDAQEFRMAPDIYQELPPGVCIASLRLPTFCGDRKMKVYEPSYDPEVKNDRV